MHSVDLIDVIPVTRLENNNYFPIKTLHPGYQGELFHLNLYKFISEKTISIELFWLASVIC